MTEKLPPNNPEKADVPQHKRLNAEGPLAWYGITFPNQEAKDKALADLQERLDRVTEAEKAAWTDIKTNPRIY